jgi:hypothetical protein
VLQWAVNPPSIPCLVLAGITCSVGAFYLLFHLKWRGAREQLPFALLCFAVAAYDVFSAGLYNAGSLPEGVFWQRLQLVMLAVAGGLTIWFLELVTRQRLSRAGRWLIATLGALAVLTLTVHEPHVTLSVSTPSVKVVRWAGRELVTYYESQLGIVNLAGILIVYFAYARLFWMLYRTYREKRSADLLGLMAGQLVYFASLLNDGLVGASAYSFFYVSEYAYLAVIMTMAYTLLGRFVDLHVTVAELNDSLERRVAEALADIKVLRGMIPICAACKKIRNDQGFWTHIEEYLTAHSEATLSHGICPDCIRALYPEVVARREHAARQPRTDK